jgi:HD domain
MFDEAQNDVRPRSGDVANPPRTNHTSAMLANLVGPLLNSAAVQRLSRITFLGILSPRHRRRTECPLYAGRKSVIDDGTRLDHTVGVSVLASKIAHQLGLSAEVSRYAAAWGLLHDIATWPLSHTGEAAFSVSTGLQHRRLREMMIRGDPLLPEEMTVKKELKELRIEEDRLLSLFDKSSRPPDRNLASLWWVVNSPLTPDSLEGIWRCGRSFKLKLKAPDTWVQSFRSTLFEPCVPRRASRDGRLFWHKKSFIYEHYINRHDVVTFESGWSQAIRVVFGEVTLVESLMLPEDEIVCTVLKKGVPQTHQIVRYKPPHIYTVAPRKGTPGELGVNELETMLLRSAKD